MLRNCSLQKKVLLSVVENMKRLAPSNLEGISFPSGNWGFAGVLTTEYRQRRE
jgi:hypothetical protein